MEPADAMLSEGRKERKGEEFKWGKELIFPYEELSLLIFLPTNLMMFLVSEGGNLLVASLFPPGSSPGRVLRSHWQLLTDLSVQYLEISATQRKALEYFSQNGSWLFLWWQKLRPAWQGFMNKPFLIIDVHVIWLYPLVLSSTHGYVFFPRLAK